MCSKEKCLMPDKRKGKPGVAYWEGNEGGNGNGGRVCECECDIAGLCALCWALLCCARRL